MLPHFVYPAHISLQILPHCLCNKRLAIFYSKHQMQMDDGKTMSHITKVLVQPADQTQAKRIRENSLRI